MAVLSIAKLRPGAEAYQLSGVAEGLDAYYTGAGEAPGRWVGGGAAALGLAGEVDGASLRAAMAGLAPGCGGLTPNGTRPIGSARRVPGFDLTFKAPKSVSVLYAVSDDPRVQGAIIDAGETAVHAVVIWLEQEAIRVRRGSNNQPWKLAAEARGESTAHAEMRELPTGGLVGAGFRHRTSRAGDPFLHWHVLVANMAQGPDGRWTSIVHPELFRNGKAAGQVFQAVLRDRLTRSLGLVWRPGRHVHEIAGVPDAIMATFSKRRAEIESWLHATGVPDTAKGAETAALATRRSKTEMESEQGLHGRWRTEAIDAGWGPEQAAELIDTLASRVVGGADAGGGVWRLVTPVFGPDGDVSEVEWAVEPEEWIADVLRRDLTVSSTTFGRPDVARAVAARLGDGASLETIGRVVDRFMASTQVIPVGDNTTGTETKRPQEYTSAEMASVESAFIATLDTAAAPIDAGVVEQVIASRGSIGADQAEAVRRVCGTDWAVSVIIGPAGTGKTFTLDAVRDAYETSGWTVVGVSPSAKGATELQAGSGIPSSTMHALQHRLLDRSAVLGRRSLVVVDEAAMADMRILGWVTTRAVEAEAKVILVGDHRQLPEVGAGGGFAYAAANSPAVAKLTRNRRQRAGWEIDALNHLRDGSIPEAVAHYRHHDRVVVQPDRAAMIHDAATRWMTAIASGETCVLAAGTNDLARALNDAVLEQLIESGRLPDTPGLFGGEWFRPGQQVSVRTNYTTLDRSRRVTNGQILTVTQIVDDTMTVIAADGTAIELDSRFLDRGGRIDHGYAVTTYRTQGGTWDRSIAVGLDGLWREGAYTALSRGRHTNLIVVAHPEWDAFQHDHRDELERHDRGIRRLDEQHLTPHDAIEDQFAQRRGKHLAHSTDPDTALINQLAQLPLPAIRAAAARALRNETVAANTVGASWDTLQTRRHHLQRIAGGLVPGVRVRVTDRNNLGTVLFLDPIEPVATVHFVSPDGAETTRLVPYHRLDPLETQANIPQRVQHWATTHLTAIDQRIDHWASVVQGLGTQPGDHDRYHRAAQLHIQRHAHTLTASPPDWLLTALGERPTNPIALQTWQEAVTMAAGYRAEAGIADPRAALGPRPAGPDRRCDWNDTWARLEQTRRWLATNHDLPIAPLRIVPNRQDLLQRRVELDQLFATAPADQRTTISQLLNGQQSFDDVHKELEVAQSQQRSRQRWILEHWPLVVEAAEIDQTLAADRTRMGVQSQQIHVIG